MVQRDDYHSSGPYSQTKRTHGRGLQGMVLTVDRGLTPSYINSRLSFQKRGTTARKVSACSWSGRSCSPFSNSHLCDTANEETWLWRISQAQPGQALCSHIRSSSCMYPNLCCYSNTELVQSKYNAPKRVWKAQTQSSCWTEGVCQWLRN